MSHRDMPRQRRDARQPSLHGRVAAEIEAALVGDVGVSIKRDVGDAQMLADEEGVAREVLVHQGKRRVAAGEVVWLVTELETATDDPQLLQEAGVAVAGMESCLVAVAHAVQEVADRGAPIEVTSSAQALQRVSLQLHDLLPRLQHA